MPRPGSGILHVRPWNVCVKGLRDLKLVLVNDDGDGVAEIQDLEQYDLSTTRGRATLLDDILVALGHADRRVVLDMIKERRERAERAMEAARVPQPAADPQAVPGHSNGDAVP